MIMFNIPPLVGKELQYIRQAVENNQKLSGDGPFTKNAVFGLKKFNIHKALLTTSCTHALEMTAILADIKSGGDEVIAPSHTFVSTVNAFCVKRSKNCFCGY